jgi:hypothetical protein
VVVVDVQVRDDKFGCGASRHELGRLAGVHELDLCVRGGVEPSRQAEAAAILDVDFVVQDAGDEARIKLDALGRCVTRVKTHLKSLGGQRCRQNPYSHHHCRDTSNHV